MAIKLEDIGSMTEPEVAKAVIEEIRSIGDNSVKNYTALRTNYEELKKTVEKIGEDTLEVSKFKKLGEDITIRQQALDEAAAKNNKDFTDRVDQIEVALKRPSRGSQNVDDDKLAKEARDFRIAAEVVTSKREKGLSFEDIEKLEKEGAFSVEGYNLFRKAFEGYVRKYGGSRGELAIPEILLKALQVGVDPDGGVTVPTSMSNRITSILYETDPMRQLAAVESISTGKMEWMAEWDEAGVEWEGETRGETTIVNETSTPGWQKRAISVHTVAARPRATQTLLEDSGINIETWLANKVAERFSRAEGAAFVSGDGIGKPRGFLTYNSGTAFGQVEQVAMGAAANITADGFLNVKYHLKEAFLERGTWLMNRTTVLAALLLKDGLGNYIWNPGMFQNGTQTATIVGLPVRMSTSMPAIAANALSVALADWRAAYLIVDRLGITVQRDPYTVKPFVEFYTRKRVGGDVDNWEAIKIGIISV